jgi:hypothetical protein
MPGMHLLAEVCLPKTCAPSGYNGARHKRSLFPTDRGPQRPYPVTVK